MVGKGNQREMVRPRIFQKLFNLKRTVGVYRMTVQLTWSFWTSLHWGVYLFLAGALLIGIAFVYELRQRRAAQKTSVFRPFADWKW